MRHENSKIILFLNGECLENGVDIGSPGSAS